MRSARCVCLLLRRVKVGKNQGGVYNRRCVARLICRPPTLFCYVLELAQVHIGADITKIISLRETGYRRQII